MDMPNQQTIHHFDVIIVGSGGAGLSLALSLPSHFNIAVLAKAALTEASTFYAQGGVAAVLDETDSIQQHINDTMIAGAHLCEMDAVQHTVEGGRPSVDFLLKQGVQFTLDEDEQLHLTREGGHSQRRIIHSADATGKAISTTLVERAKERKNITIFENYIAIDLITSHK
ncbi:FAD-binding protein, partial [Acinetobacter baumannii]|nr:FAD-binding protein [Acinetobacter baumannii]